MIDLNCDFGESFGIYKLGNDEILDYIDSINIACGFHAGDPLIMDETVRKAIEKDIKIGAHPGYPDLKGFGRRNMNMSYEEIRAMVIYQISALKGFVEGYDYKLHHVKPHGALYNMAAKDYKIAKAIAEAVYHVDKNLILVGLYHSEIIRAGKDLGLNVYNEVFADRRYTPDLNLVPRTEKHAVIETVKESIDQILNIIEKSEIIDIDGKKHKVNADTVCIHGDNIKGLQIAKELYGYKNSK